MTGAAENGDVLRVAYPRACNSQQTRQNDATGHATTTQHASLKALAQLALMRNNSCNTGQESTRKTTQQTGIGEGGFVAQDLDVLRDRLLCAAATEHADPDLIHPVSGEDLAACDGLPDNVLRTYVQALEVETERMAGRVPPGHTAAVHCARCGPVWLHPDVAAVLPVVDGWPRALGCPWCHVRKAGGYIPRPSMSCDDCRHFKPDTINPPAGVGTCTTGHGSHWPMQRHRCATFRPDKEPTA